MLKQTSIILFILTITLTSFSGQKEIQLLSFKSKNSREDSLLIKNLSQNFFDWYILNAKENRYAEINPVVIKDKNGMTTLDFTRYFANLISLSFSDSLLATEKVSYKSCIDNLSKIKYSDYLKLQDLDDFEAINCDFTNSYRWTGGQEMFDGYHAIECKFTKNAALVVGQLYYKDPNNIEIRDFERTITTTFIRQNDKWKISSISYN